MTKATLPLVLGAGGLNDTLQELLSHAENFGPRPKVKAALDQLRRAAAEEAGDPRITMAFYFGTKDQAGHFLLDHRGRRADYWNIEALGIPWPQLDGRLNPAREVEGEALLHHRGGWTALAFANRTDDTRPGCNAVFMFDAELTFEQAKHAAGLVFPEIVGRFAFEIVPAPAGSEPKKRRR